MKCWIANQQGVDNFTVIVNFFFSEIFKNCHENIKSRTSSFDFPKKFLYCFFTLLLWSTNLPAAEIFRKQNEEMGCSILVEGQILTGDGNALARFIDEEKQQYYANTHPTDSGYYEARVCFNSAGGLLSEAIRISEILRLSGTGSAVGENMICESACAIAFLGGFQYYDDGIGELNRVIHPRARLGFHAPALIVPEGQFNEDQVDAAFTLALSSINELFKLARMHDDLMPPSLMSVFLGTSPRAMRYVDTVLDASMWKISVSPVDYPDARVFENIGNSMGNSVRWHGVPNTSSGSPTLPKSAYMEGMGNACFNRMVAIQQPSVIKFVGGGEIDPISPLNTWGDWYLNFIEPGNSVFNIWIGNLGGRGDDFAHCDFWSVQNSPAFQLFPPATQLSSLHGIEGISKPDWDSLAHSENKEKACWLTSPSARIINVNEYVNLRRQPDFSAPVIRQVPLAERVRLIQANSMWFIEAQSGRELCYEACQEVNNKPKNTTAAGRVRQCIEDNRLWYEITDARGNRGWVSRKFLEEVE